ncbi:transposase family protein [Georgenia yuyongxinii]
MYHTTGLTQDQITELCALIAAELPTFHRPQGRKRALGLFKSVQVALTYLRRNRVQHDLAETFGVSQSTISRIITALMPVIVKTLTDLVPTADDVDPDTQLLVDGTLLPCWSWADHPELWSGKHHTTGVNVQVACTLSGQLAWVSDPVPGKTHDARAIRESGFLEDRPDDLGDKGYIGTGMITPIRKPAPAFGPGVCGMWAIPPR